MTPNPDFKVTPVFDAEYLRNGNTNRELHVPYSRVSFRMTLCDLLSDLVKYLMTQHRSHSLSAAAELLILQSCDGVLVNDISEFASII